mmetsp:Transcript_12107/g.25630  ORF Transcript_12107/g.25630 Transcript_12107/m.25630 type:complete len:115 (-) Transcript_12107:65-409(-)
MLHRGLLWDGCMHRATCAVGTDGTIRYRKRTARRTTHARSATNPSAIFSMDGRAGRIIDWSVDAAEKTGEKNTGNAPNDGTVSRVRTGAGLRIKTHRREPTLQWKRSQMKTIWG